MEIKKPYIKSTPYEELKDSKSLGRAANELCEGGVNVVAGSLDQLIDRGRADSFWSLTFATSCCGIEFVAMGCACYSFARFRSEVTCDLPRQADLVMCVGTTTNRMAPAFRCLYDEMAEPKYVIATGECATSGGSFKNSCHVVGGIDEIVSVGAFISGRPPCPEVTMYGMMQLQRKTKVEEFFGGINHRQGTHHHELSNIETYQQKLKENKPIIVTHAPEDSHPREELEH